MSHQSPRVDKPNNAKLTRRISRQTAGTRSTRGDRETNRQTEGRTEGCNAVTQFQVMPVRPRQSPAEPPGVLRPPSGPLHHRGPRGERRDPRPPRGERRLQPPPARRPPAPVQSVGPPESGLRGGVERKGIKYGERPPCPRVFPVSPPRPPGPRSSSSLHLSYKMSILKADKTQGDGGRKRESV